MVAPAAQPTSLKAGAPMGSSTINAEVERRLVLLNALMDKEVPSEKIQAALESKPDQLLDEDTLRLKELFKIIPSDVFKKAPFKPGFDRDIIVAEYYFYERRFIEAAHALSRILDRDSKYPRARNLLARCFYFLGNPDRTIAELEYILSHQFADAEELLDALFLMGATALESPTSTKIVKKGIAAWEAYLKIAPQNDLRARVESGLKELRGRDSKKLAKNSDQDEDSARTPGNQTRLSSLKRNAKPWEITKAHGLDAFDAGDFLLAEKKLREALALHRNDPEMETVLARIFIRTSRIQDALEHFARVIKKHPAYMPAWHYQGMAYIMNGDPRRAVDSWNQVVQKDPGYAAEYKLFDRIAVAKGMMN